jgi:hypothetical protein
MDAGARNVHAATFDRGGFDTATVWIEGNDIDYKANEAI